MTHSSKIAMLKYASFSLIAFGVLNFLALFPIVAPVMGWFMNIAFWSEFGSDHQLASQAARLWIGISGGLLAGWGVTLLMISTQVYATHQALGRRIILISVSVWYVLDSAGSLVAGAPLNAIMNLSFLGLFALPVLWPEHKARLTSSTA